jgi:hypothetical protein
MKLCGSYTMSGHMYSSPTFERSRCLERLFEVVSSKEEGRRSKLEESRDPDPDIIMMTYLRKQPSTSARCRNELVASHIQLNHDAERARRPLCFANA